MNGSTHPSADRAGQVTTMNGALFGALATAGALGVTHAIEPDHVAGISSLTSEYRDSRLSALVGACFSAGHVLLVVLWLGVGYLVLGRTEFPAVFDTVGTIGVVVLLGVLGAVTTVRGLGTVLHAHRHDHDDGAHSHVHVHLSGLDAGHRADENAGTSASHQSVENAAGTSGDVGAIPHEHGHGVRAYLKTGVIGALFTLSPPVSMIVFASTLLPAHGSEVVALAVATYAVGIVGTMSLVGAGIGTVFDRIDGSATAVGAVKTVAGLAVSAVAAWTLLGLF